MEKMKFLELYQQLDKVAKPVLKREHLIVLMDCNSKVGPNAYQQCAGMVGKFHLGETDDRDIRLQEFVQSQRLTLANTLHLYKKSRTAM